MHVLEYVSFKVSVRALAFPAVWVLEPDTVTEEGAAALTVTDREPPILVVVMVAVCALYNTIEPPESFTPLVKCIVVAVPKLITVPVLSVTVGL